MSAVTDSELAEYVVRRLAAILYFARYAKLPSTWRTAETVAAEKVRDAL